MAFQINSQYTKFVQFAERQVQAGNKTAIARLAGDPLADRTITTATIGTCTVTQDFVIDLTGPEPAIKNLQIGQTLA